MVIREATIKDLDAVTELEHMCFPEAEAAERKSFEERLKVFGGSFLLAEEDGKVIGFINGCITNDRIICDEMFENIACHNPEGDYQAILGLSVHPDYREKGIGAKLMEALITHTKEHNKKGLILTCKDRLIHYYAKFGYENLGRSASVHGGAVWYDMVLEFSKQ